MGRIIGFLFGLVAYTIFLGTFLYAIGFVSGLAVPKTIDSGPDAPVVQALIINILLMSLFAIQHSVMARPPFKRWWTRFGAGLDRAQHVRSAGQFGADPAVLAVASDSADHLANHRPPDRRGDDGAVVLRLAARSGQHFPDQSFRAVRAAPSRDQPRGANDARAPLQDAAALQGGAASDLSRLYRRILGGSRHDRRASLIRGGDDRVHLRRDLSGGARPHPPVWRGVQALPRSGRDAHSVPAQVVLKGRADRC